MSEYRVLRSSTPEGYETLVGSYVWTIEDFPNISGKLSSPVFSVGFRNEIELKLHLFEFTSGRESSYSVDVSVQNVLDPVTDPDTKCYTLQHGVGLVQSSEKIYSRWTSEVLITALENNDVFRITMIDKSFIIDNSDLFLQNNTLKVVYEVRLYEFNVECLLPSTISEDFQSVFDNQTDSDVKFLVDSQEFAAHKLVVSARSPVFAAMFETEMKESQEHQVTIEDIDAETFEELLRFMYTDKVADLEKNAYELLKAATKYNLPGLKFICVQQLFKNLNTQNCAAIFTAADIYHCSKLKQYTLDFMVNHAVAVMKTKGYELMAKSHPHLLSEAFQALATKSCTK